MCVIRCSTFSISQLWWAPSSLLWCAGEVASRQRTPTDWTNTQKKPGVSLARSWPHWRKWWKKDCWQNCWWSRPTPPTPLYGQTARLRSSLSTSNRLTQLRCLREQHGRSFLPSAIRLYNSSDFAKPGDITLCGLTLTWLVTWRVYLFTQSPAFLITIASVVSVRYCIFYCVLMCYCVLMPYWYFDVFLSSVMLLWQCNFPLGIIKFSIYLCIY